MDLMKIWFEAISQLNKGLSFTMQLQLYLEHLLVATTVNPAVYHVKHLPT